MLSEAEAILAEMAAVPEIASTEGASPNVRHSSTSALLRTNPKRSVTRTTNENAIEDAHRVFKRAKHGK
jgi:hypothetical protein